MEGRHWVAVGAGIAGVGIALGAFGAHALNERLVEADQLDNWRTAVRYMVWHALALMFVGMLKDRGRASSAQGWCFLIGTALFSGSIFGLALEGPAAVLGPITPLGGLSLMIGWALLVRSNCRRVPLGVSGDTE